MGFLRFAELIFLSGCLLYSYQASLWVCPASRQGRDSGSGKSSNDADAKELGRHLGYLLFPLMALIMDPIYSYFSKDFRGQPREGTLQITKFLDGYMFASKLG